MRAISIFAFSTALFGAVSALAIPKTGSTISQRYLDIEIERRAQLPSCAGFGGDDRITFRKTALVQLHGITSEPEEREKIMQEHKAHIEEEMKKNGAHCAQIRHLAHSVGSKDPHIHISVHFQKAKMNLKGKNVLLVHPQHWTDAHGVIHETDTHHIYTHPDRTKGHLGIDVKFPAYKKALQIKQSTPHPVI